MADIRQNPIPIDLFDYGSTDAYLDSLNPLWVAHGAGGLAAPLWYDHSSHGGFVRTHVPGFDTRALCKWSPLSLDGDDAEVWAHEIGGTGSGKSWRLSLLTATEVFAGVSGYSFTVTVGTGGASWLLRKYTNDGTGSIIASGAGGAPSANPGYLLLRRSGTHVQGWHAHPDKDDPSDWLMIYDVVDTSYTTGLIPALWTADDAVQGHGYDAFGGGPAAPIIPQIVRHNPTRKLWTP